ncbi:MAG: LysM peptidoglycan-binding domain-containing protein [Dehalococcoidia bacterium]
MAGPRLLPPVVVPALRAALLLAACLSVLLAGPSDAYAAAFNSTGTGNWTASLGGTPGVADTVTIQSGHTVTLTTTTSVAGVTVNSGGTLIISGTGSLTVGASNLVVAGTLTNGGTLIVGGTAGVTGTLTNDSAMSVTGDTTVTAPGTITNNSSTSIAGQLTGNGSLVQGTAATLNLLGTAVPAANITTLNATTNVPNTVNYNGGAQTIGTYAYWNLTLSGSGAKAGNPTSVGGAFTLAGTATYTLPAITIGGDLNVQGGTLTAPAVAITVSGNASISGGGVLDITGGAAKTFSGDITINGGTWQNNANAAVTVGGNITYVSGAFTSGSGVYTMNGAGKQIAGPLTVSAVTLIAPANITTLNTVSIGALVVTGSAMTNLGTLSVTTSLTGTGSLTNGNGATLNLAGATNTITTLDAATNPNVVNYSGGAPQTMKATTYRDLILSGSGAKTGAALVVNGTITLSGDATLTPTGTWTLAGSFVNNSTAVTPVTPGTSVFNFDTPSPAAATSIGGTSASQINFSTVNFNNTAGVSSAKIVNPTVTSVGGGASFTNTGTFTPTTLTINGAATFINQATLSPTSTVTLNSGGTLTNSATGAISLIAATTVNSGATITNNGTFTTTSTMAGLGTFTNGLNSTLTIAGTTGPTITNLDVSTNRPNLVRYSNNANQTVSAGTYSNLTLDNAGNPTVRTKTAGGALVVNGTFTLDDAAVFAAGAFSHTFAGDFVHNSTAPAPITASTSTVTFATPPTPAATSIGGTGVTTMTFATVVFANSSGVTLNNALTATVLITASQPLTVSATGTLTANTTTPMTVTSGAGLVNNGTVVVGTGALTVGTSNPATTFTNAGTATVGGLVDGVGTFTNGVNGTLNLNAATVPTIAAFNFTSNTPNTVNYGLAGAQTIRSGGYHHLTLSTSGAKTAAGPITVNGTFTMSGTASFVTLVSTHTFAGNWVNGATTSVVATGPIVFTGASATISGAGTAALSDVTLNSGASVTSFINLTTTGTFTVSSGATLTLDASAVVSGAGSFVLASGATLGVKSSLGIASAAAAGNVQTTTRTFSTGANYIYNNTSGTPQVTGNGLPATVNNLTISNPNGVTMTSSTAVTTALTLSPGAGVALAIGANTLTLDGTLSIGAGAALTGGATSSIVVGGAGANLSLPALTLQHLTVNRAAGVTLTGDATLGGTLTLTSGVLTTGANKVAVASSGSVARTAGYVDGRLERGIANGTPVTVTYDVGTGAAYTPVTLVFATVTNPGTVEVQSVAGDHADVAASAVLPGTSVNRNWLITLAGVVFTTYDVTFTFVPGDLDVGAAFANFVVAKRDGGWSSPTVGTRTATTVQATGLNALGAPSAFQIGEPAPTAPVNTVLPTVSGTTTEAETLTTTNGTWTQNPSSFAYQWRRCDAAGNNCVDIAGATASTYVLVLADVGGTVRSQVTATNGVGSTAATSAQTAVIAPLPPPSNTVPPTISGTTTQGEQLTAANGTWLGTPTFTYQWRRCDAAGNNCVDIGGATAQTYTLVLADVGGTVRVVVTGTNGAGNANATSAQTAVIAALPPPSNTVPPVISGTTTVGQTLTTTNGTWLGTPTFTYQWRRCDAAGNNCADIAGATTASYILVDADLASTIRVVVTGTNGAGSANATAAQTALIAAAPIVSNGGGGGGGGGVAPVVGSTAPEPGVGTVGTAGATTTSVSATSSSTIAAAFEGTRVQVTTPPGTLPGGATLFAGVVASTDELLGRAPLPSTADLVAAYVVQATITGGTLDTSNFAQPVVIEVRIEPSALPANANTQNLVMAYWDGAQWVETPTTVTIGADGAFVLRTEVTHFTLFGAIVRSVPLPTAPGVVAPPVTPPVSTGAGFATAPIFAASGQASAVFLGRTVADLEAAARAAGATGAWVQDANGTFGLLVVGGPSFLRDQFAGLFPAGFGGVTAVTLVRETAAPSAPSAPSAPAPAAPASGGEATTYVVTATDTLSGIAARYDLDWLVLAEANGIAGPNYFVREGQVLTIPARGASASPPPAPAAAPAAPAQTPGTYTVLASDTLSEIAARFGVSLARLAAANGIEGPAYVVRSGQVLTIPGAGPETYVVTATDTLSGIAARYDLDWLVLAEANGIAGPNYFVRAGQVLTIPGR